MNMCIKMGISVKPATGYWQFSPTNIDNYRHVITKYTILHTQIIINQTLIKVVLLRKDLYTT